LLRDKVGNEIRVIRAHRQDLSLGEVGALVLGWERRKVLVCADDDLGLETHHHVAGDVAVEHPYARVEGLPSQNSPAYTN
jgi:hypothetical protein